jgi:RHS repeat-associated protein
MLGLFVTVVGLLLAADFSRAAGDVGASGQYSQSLALAVPELRGLEPKLSLSYASGGGNGWVGVGWRLGGLSEVRRAGPAGGAPSHTSQDRFLLDGLELVPCDALYTSALGESPGCRYPSDSANRSFAGRSEVFARVEFTSTTPLESDPHHRPGGAWKVWDRDGSVRTYLPRRTPAVGAASSLTPESVESWHLAMAEDLVGNRVVYEYSLLGDDDPQAQEQYPTAIRYQPVGQGSGARIGLHWERRPDVLSRGTGRWLRRIDRRLKLISISSGTHPRLLRAYSLAYATAIAGSERSLLASVTEHGRDTRLVGTDGTVESSGSLPPIRMSWGDPTDQLEAIGDKRLTVTTLPRAPPQGLVSTGSWDNEMRVAPGERVKFRQWLAGDVDGDGRRDFIGVTLNTVPVSPAAHFWVHLHTASPRRRAERALGEVGTGRFNYRFQTMATPLVWTHPDALDTPILRPLAGDVNGDGKTDLVIVMRSTSTPTSGHIWTFLALGDGLFRAVGSPQPMPVGWDDRDRWMLGDVDGDQQADMLVVDFHATCDAIAGALAGCQPGSSSSHAALRAGVSDGDGTFAFGPAQETPWRMLEIDQAHWFAGDADADGRVDIQRVATEVGPNGVPLASIETAISLPGGRFDLQPAVRFHPGAGWGGADWGAATAATPVDQPLGSDAVQHGDFNGDGRADLALMAILIGRVRIWIAYSQGDGRYRTTAHLSSLSAQHLNVWWHMRGHRTFPNRWLTGDLDADGDDDLAVVSPEGYRHPGSESRVRLTRLVNDGAGPLEGQQSATFDWPYSCLQRDPVEDDPGLALCPEQLSFSATLGDVNGDGAADLMYAGHRLEHAIDRTLLRVQVAPLPESDIRRWVSADVDGDGRSDLISPQYLPSGLRIHVLLRQPGGGYARQPARDVLPELTNPIVDHLRIADVGGPVGTPDGRADLVYPLYDDSGEDAALRIFTLLGDGAGGWTERSEPVWPHAPPDAGAWRLADVDGDGRSDLVRIGVTSVSARELREPTHGVTIDVLRADGDGTWTRLPRALPWPGFGHADVRNWRVVDADGDGVHDLVHLHRSGSAVLISPVLAAHDGSWRRTTRQTIDTNGTVTGWLVADANGDGLGDMVQISAAPPHPRVDSLVSIGNGVFAYRSKAVKVGSDTTRWQTGDVDGDGRTDLVRARDASGVAITAEILASRDDGLWKLVTTATEVSGTGDVEALPWRVTDGNGDGRADLVAVGADVHALHVWEIRSRARQDLLTTIGNGLGGELRVAYRPSTEFLPRGSAAGAGSACHLPLGRAVQAVSRIVWFEPSTKADVTDMRHSCARWSYEDRRFLGWRDIIATDDAATNRPALTTSTTHVLTEACAPQPSLQRLSRPDGSVLAETRTQYEFRRALPPHRCLPTRVDGTGLGPAGETHTSQRRFGYDEFGNVTRAVIDGSTALTGDLKVVRREFRPATGSYVVALPSVEVLSGSLSSAAVPVRSTNYCYDGEAPAAGVACSATPGTGLVTRVRQEGGPGEERSTDHTYNAAGSLLTTTDARGQTSRLVYAGAYGVYPQQACDPLDHCTSLGWDEEAGHLRATSDPNHHTTVFEYDLFGRLHGVEKGGRSAYRRLYLDWGDPDQQRVREVLADGTADGLWSEAYLDGFGRPRHVKRESTGPQPTQRLIWYSDASEGPWRICPWGYYLSCTPERFDYDELGRLVQQSHPDGSAMRYAYGSTARGTSVTITDERGDVRTLTYDGHGRLTAAEVTDAAAAAGDPTVAASRVTYDAADRPRALVDARGNVTTWRRDAFGDVRTVVDPDLGTWHLSYDEGSNLTAQSDARGVTIRQAYDALDRPTTRQYPSGRWVTSHYDEAGHGAAIGRLTSVEDSESRSDGCPDGRSSAYSYDEAGDVQLRTDCVEGRAETMEFAFDALGRPEAVVYPDGERVDYRYDGAGRLRSVPGLIETIAYEADDLVQSVAFANGTALTHSYDPDRRWVRRSVLHRGDVTLEDDRYGYTRDGHLETHVSPIRAIHVRFVYDGLERLRAVEGTTSESYRHDAAGNIVSKSGVGAYTYPAPGPTGCGDRPCPHPNAPDTVGSETHRYDANGNLTSVSTLRGTPMELSWNEDNLLATAAVGQRTGSPFGCLFNPGCSTASYSYSPTGELTVHRGRHQTTRIFSPYHEETSSGRQTPVRAKHYFAGSWRFARRDDAGLTFHVLDRRGSVWSAVDEQGTLVERYGYAPYGEVARLRGAAHGFGGQRHDLGTGLIWMGSRIYSARLGRFLQPDTFVPSTAMPDGPNPYAFAYNQPLDYRDPSGHIPEPVAELAGEAEGGECDWCAADQADPADRGVCQGRCAFVEGETISPEGTDEPVPDADDVVSGEATLAPADVDVSGADVASPEAPEPSMWEIVVEAIRLVPEMNEMTPEEKRQIVAEGYMRSGREPAEAQAEAAQYLDDACEVGCAAGATAAGGGFKGGRRLFSPKRWRSAPVGPWASPADSGRVVIGKVPDLKRPGGIRAGERTLLSRLPDRGSPKANWKQNSSVLREEMRRGLPIRDASVGPNGELIRHTGFLRAERELLRSQNWRYDQATRMWWPPGQ